MTSRLPSHNLINQLYNISCVQHSISVHITNDDSFTATIDGDIHRGCLRVVKAFLSGIDAHVIGHSQHDFIPTTRLYIIV